MYILSNNLNRGKHILIEVKNLVKSYGGKPVVDDLSFTVESGQIYGFLGPNGAGKSTTMNILTGYIGMTSGQVTINGYDLLEEPEQVRRSIGYLPEQPPLYTDMTPKEYLDFAAELKKIPKHEREEAVDEVMNLTKIAHMQHRLIKNLSKGYRQRVGLAQAILGFPEIIILDEPMVGLDPQQIIEIRDLIKSLAGEHTIILSSHILSEVQEICDHILIIHHGKLIASGTPEELERSMRDSSVELTVKCSDTMAAFSILSGVKGVADVTVIEVADGELLATVTPENPDDDLREELFYACVMGNLPILGMKESGMSLEQVFIDLTTDTAVFDDDDEEDEDDYDEDDDDLDEDEDDDDEEDDDDDEEEEDEE